MAANWAARSPAISSRPARSSGWRISPPTGRSSASRCAAPIAASTSSVRHRRVRAACTRFKFSTFSRPSISRLGFGTPADAAPDAGGIEDRGGRPSSVNRRPGIRRRPGGTADLEGLRGSRAPRSIRSARALRVEAFCPTNRPTRRISRIAAGEGNIVTSTQTLNSLFGSRMMIPGTGIIPNNYMYLFDPHPGWRCR